VTKSSSAPPYTSVDAALACSKGSNVAIRSANVHWRKSGRRYTGEISAAMLLCLGVKHSSLATPSAAQYFGETDDTVNLRLKTALEARAQRDLRVGEVFGRREAGLTDDVLRAKCVRAFHAISSRSANWSSLTNRCGDWHRQNRTPELAGKAHAVIRREAAGSIRRGVRREAAHSLRRVGEAG